MHARVSFYENGSEQAISGFEQVAGQIRQVDGNQGAMLLVDRQSWKAITITLWDSEESLQLSAEQAQEMRQQVIDQAGLTSGGVENYEVAVDAR
jgi:heme-degrading monooxygenase HmoA